MKQIKTIQDVVALYNILENDKQALAPSHPQVPYLNTQLVAVKAGSSIFHIGESSQNHFVVIYGQINCYIPGTVKCTHQIDYTQDPLIQQVIQKMPFIFVLNRQTYIPNEYELLTTLSFNDHFGETFHKRSYSAIAVRDSLILQINYDERYWKLFEIRHTFLTPFQSIIYDKTLLSVCLKKQYYKFGESIYKSRDRENQHFYLIIEGQVQYKLRDVGAYKSIRQLSNLICDKGSIIKLTTLGQNQIFGYEEILLKIDRIFDVVCTSANLSVYEISRKNINQFRMDNLRKLMLKRFELFDKTIQTTQLSCQIKQLSQSFDLRNRDKDKEDYSQFVSLHWLKNLEALPRWNEVQMIKNMGGIPGATVKSPGFVTPKYNRLEINKRVRVSSMLEVNTEQYQEMLKTYSKRLRSEKYSDLHQCLKGQWERVFQNSSTAATSKRRESRQSRFSK